MLERSRVSLFLMILPMILVAILVLKDYLEYSREYFSQANVQTEVMPTVMPTVKPINVDHLKCLAANIYHEASSEPFLGKVFVARVVMNRVLHGFASNPCKVVYQSTQKVDAGNNPVKTCQFSWVCQGKSLPSASNPEYQQALSIAVKILTEDAWREIVPSNLLFFHNHSVKPNWRYRPEFTVGNHVFYSNGKERI